MTPADIDRVFGRGRLRMVTGEHVEVFREASLAGERRRYTKRFLATAAGDFRHWTEREWRILARLVGHGIGPVPDVVQFDRGAADRPALVQTYDAGITVDHWATLLPVQRDGVWLRHVFEDCAHWWALARHCLVALDAIHELQLVHLDLKADNVCIPFGPADFDPLAPGSLLSPRFEQIALIDFAFSLVSGESLTRALPIARQHEYDYQSPRLLQALEAGARGDLLPTRQLDWRCDVFSLAAMLRRYLPDPEQALVGAWTQPRYAQARALVRRLLEAHDAERPAQRPHAAWLALTAQALDDAELGASLAHGWTLAIQSAASGNDSPTPVTRIAMPVSAGLQATHPAIARLDQARQGRLRARRLAAIAAAVSVAAIGAPLLYEAWSAPREPGLAQGGPATIESPVAAPPPPPRLASGVDLARATTPAMPEAAIQPVAAPPQETAAPATATAPAPITATVPAPATAPAPAPATAAKPVIAKAPPRATPPVPRVRSATSKAKPAATAAKAAPNRGHQRTAAGPAARPTASVGPALSGREPALAWVTLRGPAPRSAAGPGLGEWAALALAPAPAPTSVATAAAPAMTAAPTRPAVQSSMAVPAPVVVPMPMPMPVPVPVPATAALPADFSVRARELMAIDLPQVAQRAERRVLRVMNIAGQPESAWQDEQIRRAASGLRDSRDEPLPVVELAAEDARQLHEAARLAFWRRGSAREALGLQTRAFGANPRDADIVGSLAFLSLKQAPPQAETARQLALYALTLPDARQPAGRLEDWTTLAIASALSGRDREARDAWFVSLAIAAQPERQCRAAINAYSLHGERLRGSVEALLYRAHASGRAEGSALCEWPPHWMASGQAR